MSRVCLFVYLLFTHNSLLLKTYLFICRVTWPIDRH